MQTAPAKGASLRDLARSATNPLQLITHDLDCRVPASPATAALHVLSRRWTGMPIFRIGGGCGDHRAGRQSILDWRRAVHQMCRVANAEIGWNVAAHSAICLDRLVLPGGQPEFHPRQIHTDRDDVPEMLDALQIAGI